MRLTPRSEAEAKQVAKRSLLPVGMHDARIYEAVEKPSKAGRDMIEMTIMVRDADGQERTLRDWLTDSPLGALKLRHAAEAVGALARYEAGEIEASDFPGHDVRVKIGIEKRRGYPDANRVDDYATAASPVVRLRETG